MLLRWHAVPKLTFYNNRSRSRRRRRWSPVAQWNSSLSCCWVLPTMEKYLTRKRLPCVLTHSKYNCAHWQRGSSPCRWGSAVLLCESAAMVEPCVIQATVLVSVAAFSAGEERLNIILPYTAPLPWSPSSRAALLAARLTELTAKTIYYSSKNLPPLVLSMCIWRIAPFKHIQLQMAASFMSAELLFGYFSVLFAVCVKLQAL